MVAPPLGHRARLTEFLLHMGKLPPDIYDALGKLICMDESSLRSHSSDKWFASAMPDAVAFPTSTEDVARVMRYAARHAIPVTVRGGGVGYVGGCVPLRGGIVVSTERMNRILEVTPQDGIAIVEPGVHTADLQEACAEVGWFYPPDPASRKDSTIGGNISTNAGGPRCLKYGVTRAYVLGLTVVLPDGRVLTCGGRTHKNKQGFDLVGLFCGSEGMLGIITQAILRIIPAPPARAALQATFPEFSAAARAVQAVLQAGHLPCALEIADAFTLQSARKRLGDAIPADAAGHLLLEVDGAADAVQSEVRTLAQLLSDLGATHTQTALSTEEIEALWQLRRGFSESLKATGLTKLNEDVVIPRSRLTDFVEYCSELQRESSVPIACFGHAGDGNIHTNVMVPRDSRGVELREQANALLPRLFTWVLSHGGCLTGEHGIGIAKAPWFPNAVGPEVMALHRTLKHALDPQNILNPGKMQL